MRERPADALLGQVAQIVMGQSPPGSTYNEAGIGLPFIQGSAEFGPRHPSPTKYCSAPKKAAEAGDLLLSVRAPVGDLNFAAVRTAIGRGLAVIRGNKGTALNEYLALAIEDRRSDLVARSGGGMFSSVTKQGLAGLSVPLPPIPEQRRIVDLAKRFDTAATAFCSLVAAVDDAIMAVADSSAAWTEHGLTLDDVCVAIVDCEHKTAPAALDGEAWSVGTPALRDGRIDFSRAKRISMATYAAWTRRSAPRAGDIILAREAPVGPVALVPRDTPVALGQRTVLLRPDSTVLDSRFLHTLLRSRPMQATMALKGQGLTVTHMNVADVRSLRIPRPPEIKQQQAVARLIDSMEAYRARCIDTAACTDAARNAILHDLLSGTRVIPASYDALLASA